MLLNFFETNPIPFENKINWRFKNIKYFSIISNKESIDKKFVLYSNFLKSEYKKYELIKLILLKRNNSILSIQRNIKKYLIRKQMKTYYIIQEIILKRENSALMIEKHFRSFLIRKHFKLILENDAIFLYDFPETLINQICILSTLKEYFYNKIKEKKIELSVQLYKPKLRLKFEYSKYLKCYYVPLKKNKVLKKKFNVNFIVNEEKIIDPRYTIINDSKGNFFNVINSFMIFKRLKQKTLFIKSNYKEPKLWEELFVLKKNKNINYDELSINSKTDISNEMQKNQNDSIYSVNKFCIISILKNKKNKCEKVKTCKKVSFKENVELID
jgi:hypothetical protein